MKFTLNEFFEQVNYFNQLMGEKSFWDKSEKSRYEALAVLALVHNKTETDNPKDKETLTRIFEATKSEYSNREAMVLLNELATA
jgi:hypothetical protein